MEDRGDELDLLLVALAQLLGAPVGVVGDAEPGEPVQRLAAGRRRRLAVQRGEVDELVQDRHPRVQAALLGQVAPGPARQLVRQRAVPANLARVGLEDAEADAHRRRLARPVGAEEAEDPAARAR